MKFAFQQPLILFLSVVSLLTLSACEKEPVEQAPVVRPVKMMTVEAADTGVTVEYPGTIKATQNAEMAFEVPGRITEFLVKEGTRVQQGDVLARLDARDYEAELEVARANLRKAQSDYQRSTNIFKQDPGAISKDKIESDKRALEVSQAKLAQAEKAVEDTVLKAHFDGIMARKLVEDFQNVQAKEPVLILQDVSQLEVELSVPERDVTRSSLGKSVDQLTAEFKPEVMLTSIPGQFFPARIKEFATTADPVTRTFQVKLIFENPKDVNILPGMTAKVRVEPPRPEGIWIPVNAPVADADGAPFVWQVDPSAMTVRPQPVELGQMRGADVEVLSGLEGGELIATTGVHQLRDGMQVRRYQ